jgi:hypothetical protein
MIVVVVLFSALIISRHAAAVFPYASILKNSLLSNLQIIISVYLPEMMFDPQASNDKAAKAAKKKAITTLKTWSMSLIPASLHEGFCC